MPGIIVADASPGKTNHSPQRPQRSQRRESKTFETRRNGVSGGKLEEERILKHSSGTLRAHVLQVFRVHAHIIGLSSMIPTIKLRKGGGKNGSIREKPNQPPLPPFLRVSKVFLC